MKISSSIIILILGLSLAGCNIKAPQEIASKEEKKEVECALAEVPEGSRCHNFDSVASILLPSDFENYGGADTGNFASFKNNNFMHVGYFPLKAFDESAQGLFKEGKIQEYMEYEQENICKPNPNCKGKISPESYAYMELGENRFLKYNVSYAEAGYESIHYATLINDFLIDLSSPEGQMVPNPPRSLDVKDLVKTEKIDDKSFEEILKTLTAQKK